ncbi:MAG: flagellar transcriptional regulator FlhD [Methylovulum miyakonense]|uniref:flagellar transcriptional regulator FlhD n=1 Tax=Methylovulum miyakonense TaxID=645578 RepID=UPI003BB74472
MPTLEQDLAHLNFEYLMLARECARSNPMEAAWRFGVDRKQIEVIAEFSVEKIRELSGIARAVITLIPINTPQNVSLAAHAALLTTAKSTNLSC